jgi:2-polyprenyl-3-methyl-5-hydroxy-6-metoxy-1,4-benzoquinol methylase
VNCRFCGETLKHEFVDLVASPPSNAYLTQDDLGSPESYFPLKLYVCSSCFLVQIDEYEKSGRLFADNYAYFSSYSTTWLAQCKAYAESIRRRLDLGPHSLVVEVASNDGYLLQYFKQAGIPVLGIEPTKSTASAAREKGIETIEAFLTRELAQQTVNGGVTADLLIGNNVLAHVPDINDFVEGLALLLKPGGVLTMEFPHLLRLVEECQFDTIYHEHFSYLSLVFVNKLFTRHGLVIFDVEELPTHGGSLRVYAAHLDRDHLKISRSVEEILSREETHGLTTMVFFEGFQARVNALKNAFLRFLIEQKELGKVVVGYGAAAKGNTLLNYCGVKPDLIPFVVDRSPHKQGHYLPGSHIPIVSEDRIREIRPDFVVIFPWNLEQEITEQLAYVREWDGRFVTAIPKLRVIR